MIYTSANSHLGDICWHCQIMKWCGSGHTYYVPLEYHWQIHECLEGSDTRLLALEELKGDTDEDHARNTWIACGRFEPDVHYENNIDLVEYLTRWAEKIGAEANGCYTPYRRRDLLTSFPAILRNVVAPEFDVLVINSPPRSGQCPGWNEIEMDGLIEKLIWAGSNSTKGIRHRVLCTNKNMANAEVISASLCNIGNLSLRAKLVVGVASGPIWGALNIWRTCPIYVFLDPIRLNYGPEHPVHHAVSVADMTEQLTRDGWL